MRLDDLPSDSQRVTEQDLNPGLLIPYPILVSHRESKAKQSRRIYECSEKVQSIRKKEGGKSYVPPLGCISLIVWESPIYFS